MSKRLVPIAAGLFLLGSATSPAIGAYKVKLPKSLSRLRWVMPARQKLRVRSAALPPPIDIGIYTASR